MPSTPGLKEMVRQLIATPSVSSTLPQFNQSNHAVIDLLANWIRPLGFDVAICPIAGSPGKSNLIATRGRGTGGLVLSGHTDTVPFDEALWHTNPFCLTERDQRWYGLGSADMKSFFALVLEALTVFAGKAFTHPLTILATADEESSMSGARALQAADLAGARFALIGEPTSLIPVIQHKGIMMLALNIKGSSGHSSNPDLGNSAIDAAARVLTELGRIRADLRARHHHAAFEVSYPTLNVGCIHGGDNPNRICGHVDLAFDVRILPGMDNAAVMAEIESRLMPDLKQHGLGAKLTLLQPFVQPFDCSGHELIETLRQMTGSEPRSVAFATEAPFLTGLGIETVVLGAGSIDQAHQPDEYVELREVLPAVAIIRSLISKYCMPL
jgi:acetylornithine deacetylase